MADNTAVASSGPDIYGDWSSYDRAGTRIIAGLSTKGPDGAKMALDAMEYRRQFEALNPGVVDSADSDFVSGATSFIRSNGAKHSRVAFAQRLNQLGLAQAHEMINDPAFPQFWTARGESIEVGDLKAKGKSGKQLTPEESKFVLLNEGGALGQMAARTMAPFSRDPENLSDMQLLKNDYARFRGAGLDGALTGAVDAVRAANIEKPDPNQLYSIAQTLANAGPQGITSLSGLLRKGASTIPAGRTPEERVQALDSIRGSLAEVAGYEAQGVRGFSSTVADWVGKMAPGTTDQFTAAITLATQEALRNKDYLGLSPTTIRKVPSSVSPGLAAMKGAQLDLTTGEIVMNTSATVGRSSVGRLKAMMERDSAPDAKAYGAALGKLAEWDYIEDSAKLHQNKFAEGRVSELAIMKEDYALWRSMMAQKDPSAPREMTDFLKFKNVPADSPVVQLVNKELEIGQTRVDLDGLSAAEKMLDPESKKAVTDVVWLSSEKTRLLSRFEELAKDASPKAREERVSLRQSVADIDRHLLEFNKFAAEEVRAPALITDGDQVKGPIRQMLSQTGDFLMPPVDEVAGGVTFDSIWNAPDLTQADAGPLSRGVGRVARLVTGGVRNIGISAVSAFKPDTAPRVFISAGGAEIPFAKASGSSDPVVQKAYADYWKATFPTSNVDVAIEGKSVRAGLEEKLKTLEAEKAGILKKHSQTLSAMEDGLAEVPDSFRSASGKLLPFSKEAGAHILKVKQLAQKSAVDDAKLKASSAGMDLRRATAFEDDWQKYDKYTEEVDPMTGQKKFTGVKLTKEQYAEQWGQINSKK